MPNRKGEGWDKIMMRTRDGGMIFINKRREEGRRGDGEKGEREKKRNPGEKGKMASEI